jgi:hypothetical protein
LLDVLVWNRPTAPREIGPVYAGRWSRPARIAAKTVAILFAVFQIFASWRRLNTTGDRATKPPLYGAYDVEQFVRNGDDSAPLVTDTTHWRRVIVSRAYETAPVSVSIRLPNEAFRQYEVRIDTVAKQMTLLARPRRTARAAAPPPNAQPTAIGTLAYAPADSGRVVLAGTLRGDTVSMRLRRMDQDFRLLRPVRWFRVPGQAR